MTDVVALPGIWDYDNITPFLYFGTPGNPDANDGYNATAFFSVQICDELNQTTAVGLGAGVQANCTAAASTSAYTNGSANPDVKQLLKALSQGPGF